MAMSNANVVFKMDADAGALLSKLGAVQGQATLTFKTIAASANQAGNAAFRLGGRVAVKAQVLGPGRAAGGGVKLTSSDVEAGRFADSLLGSQLVTTASGPAGVTVRRVLVEQAVNASKELAVGIDAQESGAVISAKTGDGPVTQVSVDPAAGRILGEAGQALGRDTVPPEAHGLPTRVQGGGNVLVGVTLGGQ